MKIVHLHPPMKPTDPRDDPCGDPWDKQSPSLRDGQPGDPATRGPGGARAAGQDRTGPFFKKSHFPVFLLFFYHILPIIQCFVQLFIFLCSIIQKLCTVIQILCAFIQNLCKNYIDFFLNYSKTLHAYSNLCTVIQILCAFIQILCAFSVCFFHYSKTLHGYSKTLHGYSKTL